ncbi:hypothetical protein ACJZ2D_011554 [Fusarium nematophilum]
MADYCSTSLTASSPENASNLRTVRFFLPCPPDSGKRGITLAGFSVVVFPTSLAKSAMGVWMDTGAGMSTRHAGLCLDSFDFLASDSPFPSFRTLAARKMVSASLESSEWLQHAPSDLQDLQARVAQLTTSEKSGLKPVKAEDVLIFPTGMNAIFTASEALAALSPHSEVVAYGWLYPETVHVLRKSLWEQVVSFKWGTDEELDELESMLTGQRHRISALFCELPSNIKFISPNLERIRCSAGSPGANIFLPPSVVVNPNSRYYDKIRGQLAIQYNTVCCFPSDVAALKRNSANMADRVRRANSNTLVAIEVLQQHPSVSQINHPSLGPTSPWYERCRRQEGGYGNVLSVVFHNPDSAQRFYDSLDVCKGSSFGTNFTLAIPYVQLACYWTQEKCEKYGLPRHIIRISVGLENPKGICRRISLALAEVERFERLKVARTQEAGTFEACQAADER